MREFYITDKTANYIVDILEFLKFRNIHRQLYKHIESFF